MGEEGLGSNVAVSFKSPIFQHFHEIHPFNAPPARLIMPSYPMYLMMSLSGLVCLALDLALMWWDRSILWERLVSWSGERCQAEASLLVLKSWLSHHKVQKKELSLLSC